MGNSKSDDQYRAFILDNLPRVTALFKTVDISDDKALQETFEREDISDLIDALSTKLSVNCDNFHMENHFPWKAKTFFIKKNNNVSKVPLTLRMFIDSAKAGRWLYS
ncbi:DUF1493 family protein [Pseudescherichia sp.]|uniref:DUF1493 family protein n=1 Tax=Pseudescherichia sp. TaxID=2055881 RepID=UPI0028A22BFA|nr:DUF1493 family protein [Pseudescherichia sp.]